MLGIVVNAGLVYLVIGATLWALVLHPLDQARDVPLSILTWPRDVARWLSASRASADDPYFFPIGEYPTAEETQLQEFRRDQLEKICDAFGGGRR